MSLTYCVNLAATVREASHSFKAMKEKCIAGEKIGDICALENRGRIWEGPRLSSIRGEIKVLQ